MSPENSGTSVSTVGGLTEPIDLASCKNLPTLPHVAMEIMEVTLRDDASLGDLADVAALDPALSVKILRTVNSAFYGFTHEITTLQHAISILE